MGRWQIKKLEDLVIKGGLVRGPFGGALKKEIFKPSGYKVYEQRNAIYGSVFLGEYFIDKEKYESLRRFKVHPGDFIISCSGTIGRIYRLPDDAPEGVINQALLKITVDENIIVPEYFYQYFRWDKFQAEVIDNTQGGAMQNLVGMDIFRSTKLRIPAIDEQKRIVEVLETWDEYLELLDKKIALKERLKKGLMQQLLTGMKRLPGFIGEWKVTNYGNLCSFQSGFAFSSKHFSDTNGIRLIRNRDLKSDENKIYYAPDDFSPSYIVHEGDILIGMDGDFMACRWHGSTALLNQRVGRLMDFKDTDPDFIFYMCQRTLKAIENETSSTTVKHLSAKQFETRTVRVPDYEEQKAVSSVLISMDRSINLLKQKKAMLEGQKKYLMKNLITGTIRVPERSAQKEAVYA